MTNDELAGPLGTSAAELAAISGVARRHWAEPGTGPSDLARAAALDALAQAGREPTDVGLIVFATMTPDIAFPGSGCFLQHKLGCDTIGALDVRAQCAGFLFALASADRFVRAGAVGPVLVVGGEVYSTALDLSPRGAAVTPYFGDGAGALLLGPAERPGVRAVALHTDPTGLEYFWCEYPSSRHHPARMEMEHFDAGLHFYRLDAGVLHAEATRRLGEVVSEVLERAGVPADGVALYLLHYLDHRVARRAADALGLPPERVVATAEAAGHMGAAGIPIALADAVGTGRVGPGDLVCCAAFGAGLAWGAAVLEF